MFKSLSTSLILRGVLAVIVGIIALAWPQVTVLALVILFAIYAFIAAAMQGIRAFSSATAGPVIGHLLLALVDVAAGVIALVWPGPTALVLVLIVGICAVMAGIFEIFAGFAPAETAGTRALFFLTGPVSEFSRSPLRSASAGDEDRPGRRQVVGANSSRLGSQVRQGQRLPA